MSKRLKPNESFMMTLNRNTLHFLEGWYEMPIQDILRTLASVDKASKETLVRDISNARNGK
jgi:hypothetical protein